MPDRELRTAARPNGGGEEVLRRADPIRRSGPSVGSATPLSCARLPPCVVAAPMQDRQYLNYFLHAPVVNYVSELPHPCGPHIPPDDSVHLRQGTDSC